MIVFRALGEFGSITRYLGAKMNMELLATVRHMQGIKLRPILTASASLLWLSQPSITEGRALDNHTPAHTEKTNQAMKLVMFEEEASGIWSNPNCRAVRRQAITPATPTEE